MNNTIDFRFMGGVTVEPIQVYGKEGCTMCQKAKEKLSLMGFDYESRSLEEHIDHHEGWRDDNTIDLMASYALYDSLPIIEVNGQYYDYPTAMKTLKKNS